MFASAAPGSHATEDGSTTGGVARVAYLVAQVQYPVASDDYVRILEQVLADYRAEVALAGTDHHGHDIHGDVVHDPRSERLAADVARVDRHRSAAGELLRLRDRVGHPVDEVERGFRVPAGRLPAVGNHDHVLAGRGLAFPAVGDIEHVAPDRHRSDAVPHRLDVVIRRLRDPEPTGCRVVARTDGFLNDVHLATA